jgi:predicted metal-dependent HD superfamily phosphohydrolase
MEFLNYTWKTTFDTLQIPPEQTMELFQKLCMAYQCPTRHYHNLQHIQQMLTRLHRIRVSNQPSITLAIWFHDAIYNARAKDNEERSAQWAIEALSELGIDVGETDRIAQWILATQSHRVDPNDRDGQVFLDCDLSILGVSPEDYNLYAQAIRQEYDWVTDEDYRVGRSRVLQNFLDRDRLYHCPELQNDERQAHQNLASELNRLQI